MRLPRLRCAVLLLSLSAALPAQISPAPAGQKPLPDIPTLMHEVEAHQREAEAVEKDYIFREDSVGTERRSDGSAKKSEERAYDIFWIDGVRLARMVRKDGKDLSPDELKKENDRLDKEVARAKERRAKADQQGKESNSNGRDEITVSRILELGNFSNPRRESVNGRPTIVVDYKGNPTAKSRNQGEAAFKLMGGTIWVDEQDRTIAQLEGHFDEDFKIGAGLVASVRRGTSFRFHAVRINNEVWLPARVDFQGEARYLLFFSFNGDGYIQASDYRKFKATSTIVGIGDKPSTVTDPTASPQSGTPPAPPPP